MDKRFDRGRRGGDAENLPSESPEAAEEKTTYTLSEITGRKGPWFGEVSPEHHALFQVYVRANGEEREAHAALTETETRTSVFVELRSERKPQGEVRYARIYPALDARPTERVEYEGFGNRIRAIVATNLLYSHASRHLGPEDRPVVVLKRVSSDEL